MLIKDLIKLSLEYNDNYNFLIKKFFSKYFNNKYYFNLEKQKEQYFIIIYTKTNKKKVASCKINKLFDYIDNYNVLYWDWANVNTTYYNLDVKKIWEYGFNLINLDNKDENDNLYKFLRIIFLNSGLIINNNLTLNLIISLISYILKKGVICFKYNNEKNNFKLIYNDLDINRGSNEYIYSYYYSVIDFKELKGSKFVDFK